MPWSPEESTRHKKSLSGSSKSKWASIANKILAQSGDEGKAIRIANSKTKPSPAAIKRKLNKPKGI